MSVGSDLQRMGRFLEEFESGPGTIRGVEFLERIDSETGPTVEIEIAITPSTSPENVDPSQSVTKIDADGRIRFGLKTRESVVPSSDDGIDVEPVGTALDEDGTVTVTVRASVGNETGATSSTPRESSSADSTETLGSATDGGADRELPPFRDPELLAEVYESCDTFAEMSDAIEMDVTGETVRRYMIDYGIHEPNSHGPSDTENEASRDESETETPAGSRTETETPAGSRTETETPAGSRTETDTLAGSRTERDERTADPDDSTMPPDEDRQSPVVLTDGIGVHDDVTVDTLVETISRSNTVYEVEQEIGLDREETRELLRKLDLLDLVTGRIATEHEREISRETVLDRLRTAAETDTRERVAV